MDYGRYIHSVKVVWEDSYLCRKYFKKNELSDREQCNGRNHLRKSLTDRPYYENLNAFVELSKENIWLNIDYYRRQCNFSWNTLGILTGDKNIHQLFLKRKNIGFEKLIAISYSLQVTDLVLLLEDFELKQIS